MNKTPKNIGLFINSIFGDRDQDEQVLYWASSSPIPGFPQSEKVFDRAARGSLNKACYFSTSTVELDEDGKLYNRQKLFKKLYCIVLDDMGSGLGSKCKIEDLPDVLRNEYSWRIETSPDNFQYGFLLDTPIDNLYDALSLIHIIYGAGPWDSGGATSNKLVRLPCGLNLKTKYADDEGELFRLDPVNDSELFTDEPFNTFTPDELLEAVRAGVTWADVQSGNAGKLDPRRTKGATPWREGIFHSSLDGVVDDGLEWLNEENLVVNEGAEWFDIICPWHDGHTDGGGNTAGYKPLGFGSNPETRAFHCFHDHCSKKKARDFLDWMTEEKGPILSIFDPVPLLVAEWALDESNNTFVSLRDPRIKVPNAGFKTGHQSEVWWVGANGKPAHTSEYNLILKSKGLLKLMGDRYDPGGPGILEQGAYKKLNSWSMPQWEIQKIDRSQNHWKEFTGFIKYLIPNEQDAEWFLDHLAAKAQDPKYRGPCVVLWTPVQGSGRGTLERLIGDLWGAYNSTTVGLSELIDGLSGKNFNDFLLNMWTVVPEAKDSQLTKAQEAKSYESLKTGLDPAPTSHVVKVKYGGQGPETVYSSTIICSNHEGALNIPPTDRRFLSIECTVRPATTEYFKALNAWRATNWCPAVWNELKTRDISHHSGFAPKDLQRIQAPEERIAVDLPGQSPIDRIATVAVLFANTECDGLIHTPTICHWVSQFQIQLGVPSFTGWESVLKRDIQNATSEIKPNGARKSYKFAGKKCFIRHTLSTDGYSISDRLGETWDYELIRDKFHTKTAEDFRDFVLNIFNEAGI